MNDTYLAAISVDQMFADTTYQRELQQNRATAMAHQWQPRLVGVIDVSDRGEDATPRYAIINGQHRWAAATRVDPQMSLPANVHTGLTVAQEAQLFWDIDRKTKKLSTWDRWYARRSAGDPIVIRIDRIAADFGYTVTHLPSSPAADRGEAPAALRCCAALEWTIDLFDDATLRLVLELIGDIWPGDPEALKAPVIKGLARVFGEHGDELDSGRLADALSAITPSQLVARAHELKSRGFKGGVPTLAATAALMVYNRSGTTKIRITQ